LRKFNQFYPIKSLLKDAAASPASSAPTTLAIGLERIQKEPNDRPTNEIWVSNLKYIPNQTLYFFYWTTGIHSVRRVSKTYTYFRRRVSRQTIHSRNVKQWRVVCKLQLYIRLGRLNMWTSDLPRTK